MRRKPGTLLPLEIAILDAGITLRERGSAEFHGYLIAHEIRERDGARRLTAHGTLYKALDRMRQAGLLTSRWEDPQLAADEHRPLRRLYEVTLIGEQAREQAIREQAREQAIRDQRPSPASAERGLAPS